MKHAAIHQYALIGIASLLALVFGLTACAGGTIDTPQDFSVPGRGLGYVVYPLGATSLKERIARSDVVAKVRLQSVAAEAVRWDSDWNPFSGTHVGALGHRFRVLEYLKGSGGNEIVAVAYDDNLSLAFGNAELAKEHGKTLLAGRDTHWDVREAIVFLLADRPWLPDFPQRDRYVLGHVSTDLGDDFYTIDSPWDKTWLPDAADGDVAGASGTQRFLLDAPAVGATGQTDTPTISTITLTEMKAEVAGVEAEVAAGGGSDAYRACIYEKHKWERKANAKTRPDGSYPYTRYDEAIGSGQPAGTRAHTFRQDLELEPESQAVGKFYITGQDQALFAPRLSGAFDTVRPLPAGEYKFNPYYMFHSRAICDAIPEVAKGLDEVFVTVTAPAGTVHEAFFDLLVGAAGVPLPSDFTVGGAGTAIHWLEWRDGTVLLLMAPYVDLKGHTLDFIALNGTVALSLDAGAATADPAAGTLTWAVASQPWREDDQLMLRIRKSAIGPTATPTPTPTPTSTPTPMPLAAPDAPANLAAAPEPTAVGLRWETVAGAARYRVEHRPAGGTWTTDDERVAAPPYQVTGLTCATAYEFRVSAYGDGTARAAAWGTAATLPASTAACPPTPTPTPKPTPEPLSPVVAKYDLNGNGRIEATEYYAAAWDYGAGKITYAEVLEVAEAFRRSAG